MRTHDGWRYALVAALLAALLASAALGAETQSTSWEQLQALYDYDHLLPLQAQITGTATNNYYITERMTLRAVDNTPIPAILHRPNVDGPVPCVLLLHGYGGDKESYSTPMAMLMAPQGIAVMAIDARLHGERAQDGVGMWSQDLRMTLEAMVKTVIDNRRALDYLDSRADIVHDRYMLLGISMGGILGAILGPVDERVKSAVLIVAGGRLDTMFLRSDFPAVAALREAGVTGEMLAQYLYRIEPLNFIGHFAPRPLLFVNGTEDKIIPRENAEMLHQAACEPKQLVWYEGGHIPPPQTVMSAVGQFVRANMLN